MEKTFLSFRIHSFLGGWGYYFEVMFGNFGKTKSDFFPHRKLVIQVKQKQKTKETQKHPQITF